MALPRHGFKQVVYGSGPFDDNLAGLLTAKRFCELPTKGEELFVVAYKSPPENTVTSSRCPLSRK